ncbi:hypothetical protein L1049_010426 [Liquidambar formosana]|uniref:Uncharacterized protein n=1 Tax=Liquidambar formosana TaxID=63359 RepID=A0AAP0R4V5_LIQFO
MLGDVKSQEHTLVQESGHSIHKPCLALHKECEHEYVSDMHEGKTRIEKRKVTVRSSYFQHKVVNKTDCDGKNETLSIKDDVATNTCENTIPENASFGEMYFKGTLMKRKVASINNVQTANVDSRYKRANASLPNKGDSASTLDDTLTETKTEEGKFGCNISHIDQYSDIAEKSMKNFVSVISTFRCSSSGSRASGLRAPLKDVQNTCTNRSTVGMDLSKFAYAPNKQRAASAYRRG